MTAVDTLPPAPVAPCPHAAALARVEAACMDLDGRGGYQPSYRLAALWIRAAINPKET